jgi:pimeloyl-ACP methyl ester carboxylesterase
MARDAAGLIESVGFHRAHVLGFSMGGAIAQELALRSPNSVDRLVLFSTFAGFGFTVPAQRWVQKRLFDVEGLSAEEAARQVWPVTYSPEYLKANQQTVEAQMYREIEHPTPDHVARGQRTGLRAFSTGFRLWQIGAKTLVAAGAGDQIVPPANSQILANAIAGARLQYLSGLGHRAIWEAPKEAAELVTDFLTSRDVRHTPS